jgi:hypothetical protein
MAKHAPPIPPAGRSTKGPSQTQIDNTADRAHVTETDKRVRNLDQQGRQGNISQNTHHQGYQQDR